MSTTATQATPKVNYRKDYSLPPYLTDTVELEFFLEDESTRVRSTLAMRRNPQVTNGDLPLVLDGEELELSWVELDGERLDADRFRVTDDTLTIYNLPAEFSLRTEVVINPRANTALSGLYKAGPNFCTQCEAEGFRRITWYLDRPDVMAKFRTYMEADKARNPVLLSNGNYLEGGDLEGGRHWARWEDPFKKPSYLFALVAGQLECIRDSYRTCSGRDVALEIYVEKKDADKCDHAMRSLKKSMQWDEDVFGLEYDLDQFMIVAVDDFNMGAMENKGLNIFNSSCVLALPDTATDADFDRIEGVIAHEYFHNWTGNRVTCRDWFQLTLKEGLTVFRDQQFTGDMHSLPVQRIEDVTSLRGYQFAEDAGPMAHPIRPESYIEMNNFYTSTVYEKGAEVIRMYHTLLGAKGFRAGMDLYFERHDGGAVTCDDFRAAMADANSFDLEPFERWYSQAGTPRLAVKTSHDAAAKTFTIEFSQSCPATPDMAHKQPFHIPIAVGLLGPDGTSLALQLEGENQPTQGDTRLLELFEAQGSFTFVGIESAPVASILRNFSAPVVLEIERSNAEYAFLMAHDADPFSRWDAGQEFGTQLLLEGLRVQARGESWELPPAYLEAFGATLSDTSLDCTMQAMALCLPGEAWLADRMEVADPVAVHATRKAARAQLARAFRDEWLELYEKNRSQGKYSLDSESVGRRSLAAVSLGYLMELEESEISARCLAQFHSADNMTDAGAALALLCSTQGSERDEALSAFYERWKSNSLVLNKWFSMQARADLPDVLERVQKLLEHPDFTFKNPNRARSVISAFAHFNPAAFHAADGSGYRFLTRCVVKMDAINPQVASRLIDPLLAWRRLDSSRQNMLKASLKEILATDELSKDVFEKASKALG
ncbi:MAG TPA: aminopeptidase N [Planctomycetes bacterium]|jgi:aminopeptidase N|nr:aminopeptidase N [Planctomycetota bacterium]